MSHYFYITPEEYELAARNGVDAFNLGRRVRLLGWPKEKAMQTPLRRLTNRKKWSEIAQQNGISYQSFMSRIARGWDEEFAATKPLQTPEEVKENALKATEAARRFPKKYIQMAESNGIPYQTFWIRVKKGWSLERAATQPVMSQSQCGQIGAKRVRELYGDWNRFSFTKGKKFSFSKN